MNVMVALFARKNHDALILSVNTNANVIQDWVPRWIISRSATVLLKWYRYLVKNFDPTKGLEMKESQSFNSEEESCIDINECNLNGTHPCDLNAKEYFLDDVSN